jgi:hypothetical protein
MDATSLVGRMRVFSIFTFAVIIDRCRGVIFLLQAFFMALATYTIQAVRSLRTVKRDVPRCLPIKALRETILCPMCLYLNN